MLINAYRKVRPNLKLVIAGGSSHTDRYERMLRKEASEDIIFVGYQYGESLRALYSNCRLFVFPSYIEGLPLVLLEALSFLRPVVFSDIPENLEIADGLGVRFQCGSLDDLATKLEKALSNTNHLEALRAATQERLSREYDWDRVADRYLKVYQEVMAAYGIRSVVAQQPSTPE